MTPFFTIIVSCCDVAPYLRECLDSVANQPFKDWECLLGVEESKDDTEKIAREYAAKDPRFKVFTGPRSGSCSASRNTGIDMASGEYVIFLDGDDTIVAGTLLRLHDKIAERPEADLYPCAIQVHNDMTGKDEELRDNYPKDFSSEISGPEATLVIYRQSKAPCPMLQMNVFRLGHLVENHLKCLYGRKRQDSEFTPRALYFAKRVIPLHIPFYIYRIRADSISMSAKTTDYFLKDYAAILNSLFRFHAKVSTEPGFDSRLSHLWAQHWLTWLFYYWFSTRAIKLTTRAARAETLQYLFAKGFADFNTLLRASTFPRRFAAVFIRIFVRHPMISWLADAFFMSVYNLLTRIRDSLHEC
jgi:glycosyltransferase involved in cell wall biosynthesis